MNNYKILIKITGQFLFVIVIIFFSTLNAKNIDKFYKSEPIADYFSGILLLNQNKYEDSYKYLKKLDGLEKNHQSYATKYLYTLVNSGNFNLAVNFAKKLEKEQKDSFESDLVIGVFNLKNLKFEISKKYFLKAKQRYSRTVIDNYVARSLYNWSNLDSGELEKALNDLRGLDDRFESLKKIQNTFLHCYFDSDKTKFVFEKLLSNQDTDFSRYNYFFAKYLFSKGEKVLAKTVTQNSLKKYPRNLLLNQFEIDLKNKVNNFEFDCKKIDHVVAEILYITANALSSQSAFALSNFYLNLSKYLNKNFHAFDTLLAENLYKIDDFSNAKKIYQKLKKNGEAFEWYSNKQISRIFILQGEREKGVSLLNNAYKNLYFKGVYQMFDYAEFLKNNERFSESIQYYTKILDIIDKDHQLYPEVTDGRGVSFERIGEWDKAEKDLLASLEVSPNQAYVINYLAYSWIEKGLQIEKSLSMLEKANQLKSNDPYIIDSLGWALFKLKRYNESKKYLQLAVSLMPSDPIVNDHYGDVLWKNGNEIQARYYWNYVLNLEKAEKDLKEKIEQKLIKGL